MIIIVTRPDRYQESNPAIESTWVAVRHPCLFKLQRRDFTLISCNDNFGNVVLKANYDAQIDLEVFAGDELYFASTLDANGNAGNYGVVGTVASIATNVGVEHLIYMDSITEVPATTGGYFNLMNRANYYTAVEIDVTDMNTNIQHQIPCKLKGGIDGNMRLDVSDFITTYLVKNANTNYAFVNILDPNVYGKFSIVTQQFWTGSNELEVSDLTEYFFVDAVKQLQDTYGQNMCDYLMFPATVVPLPKWLTDFDSPTFFAGYPFDISFIYPDSMVGLTLRRNEQEINGAGGLGSLVQTPLADTEIGGVNRIALTETYTAGTKSIDLYLDYNDGVSDIQLLETKRIKLSEVCGKNPIYLKWRNTKGGFDHWLFEKNQTIGYQSKSGAVVNREPDDLADQNFRAFAIQNETAKKIICGATVSINDLEGIRGIESSPAVYVFTGVSSYTWLRMRVIPKGFQYQTKGVNADIQIELEYPELYTVSN